MGSIVRNLNRRHANYELAVRPYVSLFSLSRPRKVEPVVEVPEAFVEWGQPSTFEERKFHFYREAADPSWGFHVIEWSEVNRDTIVIRVSNPDDATQFVDVERIENIEFKHGTDRLAFALDHSGMGGTPVPEE